MEIEINDTMTEGQAKDLILEHLCKFPNRPFSAEDIKNEVLTELHEDMCLLLIKRIGNTMDEIVRVYEDGYDYMAICSTGVTEPFLKQGGFSQIEESDKKHETGIDIDQRIKELTIKNLELSNKQKKRYVLYSVIAFLSGAIVTNIKEIIEFLTSLFNDI